jgi:hypothetical protein
LAVEVSARGSEGSGGCDEGFSSHQEKIAHLQAGLEGRTFSICTVAAAITLI